MRKITLLSLAILTTTFLEPAAAQRRVDGVDGWLAGTDYSAIPPTNGVTGTATVNLSISDTGRADRCSVLWDNGHPALGKATCALLIERARYIPARDETGKPVRSKDMISISWPEPPELPRRGSTDFGGAIPLNSPGEWVTDLDYPKEANALDRSRVALALNIGSDGRVANCTLLESSQNAYLDRYTCALLVARARFKAPVDEQGKPFATKGQIAIMWDNPGKN